MQVRRVVITGIGAVSPFGIGMERMMQALSAGESAVVSQKEQWESRIHDLNCWVGAPLREALPPKAVPRKFRRTMGPAALMALHAAQEAIKEAGLPQDSFGSGRTGVSFSSSMGSVESLTAYFREYFATASLRNILSGAFFQVMSHTCAANIAHALEITGRVISPDSACSSSAQAIGLGYEAIRFGIQDVMICGGADELDAVVCGSFDLLNATSCRYNDRPKETPRPFDADRDGTVCGEGAGCLVLESEESALKRGASILAEVTGFSTSADGTHLAQPHSASIVRCMRDALANAGLAGDEVDYINAHATGTLLGDQAEAEAIREVFGAKDIPVSSLKGHMGHTLGASAALELGASLRMMHAGRLIPTLNLSKPGEGCDSIVHADGSARKHQVNTIVKNSFAFGGINTVLIVRRYANG